jgi:hypothetical protein
VLAGAGEISSADWDRLEAHLEECQDCRETFADAREIHARWLPERPGYEIVRDRQVESLLASRILKQVSREAGRPSKAAMNAATRSERSARLRRIALPAVSIAAAVLLIIAVRDMAWNGFHGRPGKQTADLALRGIPKTQPEPSSSPRAQAILMATSVQETTLREELKSTREGEDRLARQLQDARAWAGGLKEANAVANQKVSELQQQLEAERDTEAKQEAELASLKEAQTVNAVVARAQDQEIHELRDKLSEQSASLSREQDLMSAGREIRDLIAARNLHIIDVYDTNQTGKTQKSFGRVFYTEGKSLVFYAYDLPAHGVENTKYAFYAWGKRDGNLRVIRRLGIFFNDDQVQKRWVVTVTDPGVLSEIDSVFVTLEQTKNPGDEPRGKKLLSAYLKTPANHP